MKNGPEVESPSYNTRKMGKTIINAFISFPGEAVMQYGAKSS